MATKASKSKYFNIYGARYNQDKSRVNIAIVRDNGNDKEWATISLKTEDKQKIIVRKKGVYLAVKFLEDFKDKNESTDDESTDDEECLPF